MFILTKHIFIINPAAGKGREAGPLKQRIEDACASAGVDFDIYCTKSCGDGTRYVRETVAGKEKGVIYRFYACGGDGTLSEVISGAVNENLGVEHSEVEIGCIPIGTGNDFVRNYINREFFCDITKQILSDAKVIDCYRYGDGLYGLNMVNIGFDCEAAARVARYKKKVFIPKGLAYIAGVAVELIKNKGKKIKVTLDDGRVIEKEFQLVSTANGAFCGGGFNSAPKASLSDGILDVILIDKVNRRTFLKLVGAYKNGTYLETVLGQRVANYSKAKSVLFEFSEPSNICIDGEIAVTERVEITVIPDSVAFVFPIGCEMK